MQDQPAAIQYPAGAAGVLAELAEATRAEAPSPSRIARKPPGAAELARDAERILLADSAYRDELARWAGGARVP